jgi:phosphoribosyl 1,2-cyclic phosphate phosphodiesterase
VNENEKEPLQIYSTKASVKDSLHILEKTKNRDEKSLNWNEIIPFETYEILNYKVTPLKADHEKEMDPVIYIIEKDNKAILYAHDTGYFLEETWEYIENSNIKFDFAALDCTYILNEQAYNNHMGLKACCDVKERLLKKNATENTVFCLHHFSHNGKLIYDDLVPVAKELGFEVTYDSIEFEI